MLFRKPREDREMRETRRETTGTQARQARDERTHQRTAIPAQRPSPNQQQTRDSRQLDSPGTCSPYIVTAIRDGRTLYTRTVNATDADEACMLAERADAARQDVDEYRATPTTTADAAELDA
jgi:hypothetical protein